MDLEELYTDHLKDATNVLVLTNLSPSGAGAYTRLLSRMCPDEATAIAVTYTQPPDLWLSDWDRLDRGRPRQLVFVHGGPSAGEDIPGEYITSYRVDPSDPMDIIATVTDSLEDDRDGPSIVSVQTLTVLLEYVDFDTAFRYLHVLVHRVRGSDARAFYQMDPQIHGPETINTLSVLFDVVVEAETNEAGDVEWRIVDAKTGDIDEPSVSTESTVERISSWINAARETLVSWLHDVRTSPESSSEIPETPVSQPPEHHHDPAPAPPQQSESLLTDEERIRRLLLESGGRMNQADIVNNTDWSGPTVSRKLTKMEEDGMISRVQVGRGNLVFLDGHQPNIAGSSLPDHEDA